MENTLWEKVGNKCLRWAVDLLDEKDAPTEETVGAVERLVGIAIAIDESNLHWANRSRLTSSLSAWTQKGE
jgi:hypothetical protein